MVIKDCLIKVCGLLKNSTNDNPIFEGHLIVRHFLKMTPMELVLDGDREIDEEILKLIDDAVSRRLKNEPLQYILSSQEFMGLEFYVDKNVLVPRSDTETLVEHILSEFVKKPFMGLDIGTGTGCIAVSLAHFSKLSHIRGIDISEETVKIAKRNAQQNMVSERTCFEVADIFTYSCFGKYDLIVSNPPYIETDIIPTLSDDVKNFEPISALDGGVDGLDYYRHIVSFAPSVLRENGMLAFEVGHTQAKVVADMMEKEFCDIKIVKDLCGIERVVSGRKKSR